MIHAEDIAHTRTLRNDKWVPAEPIAGPWLTRLSDALSVLYGDAHAVVFDRSTDTSKNIKSVS